jgi:hypothetical protein
LLKTHGITSSFPDFFVRLGGHVNEMQIEQLLELLQKISNSLQQIATTLNHANLGNHLSQIAHKTGH